MKEEEKELTPHLVFTITDEAGNFIRRLTTKAQKGINRITWDLRYQDVRPVRLKGNKFNPTSKNSSSFPVIPGRYFVSMDLVTNDKTENLVSNIEFNTEILNNTTIPAKDRKELENFQKKTFELARVVLGTQKYTQELRDKIELIKQAIYETPSQSDNMFTKASNLCDELDHILFLFNGEPAKASDEEIPPAEVSLNSRLGTLLYTNWRSTSNITENQKRAYKILFEKIPIVQKEIRRISDVEIKKLEQVMESNDAPWTPGRLPEVK